MDANPTTQDGQLSARAFAWRMSTFYGALFIVYGMHVPYTPVWLHWRGLSSAEISAVMAAPFFIRILITPLLAVLADRKGHHRRFLLLLGWLSIATAVALSQAPAFWPILILTATLIVSNSAMMPLAETIAVSGVRHRGLDYGRMRLWGSLTFVAASFVGGLAIQQFGGGVGIWLVILGLALTAIVAHAIPKSALEPTLATATSAGVHANELKLLLTNPAFLIFLVAAGLTQAAHATFLTFGTLIWQSQGLSGGTIGALWAIGVIAEVAVFWISGPLVAKVGPAKLFVIAASASCLRWFAMGFDPNLWLLVPLSLLHGITYGASHIGAIHFIHRSVPPQIQGSAQALYSTMAAGLAMGFATLIAGRIYALAGGQAYFAMSGVAFMALIAALKLKRMETGVTAPVSSPDADVPLPEPLESQV